VKAMIKISDVYLEISSSQKNIVGYKAFLNCSGSLVLMAINQSDILYGFSRKHVGD
jgi:hypothetical protein